MSIRSRLRWLVACTGFAVAGAVLAQPTNPDLFGAVWAGGAQGIARFSATDNSLMYTLPQPIGVTAVAADPGRRVLWALASPNLYALDFEGQILFSVPTPVAGTLADLVVRPTDGSVWVGAGRNLRQYLANGQAAGQITLTQDLKALAMTSATLWVATTGAVESYDAISGQKLSSLTDLGSSPKVQHISTIGSKLWVGLTPTVRSYTLGQGGSVTFVESRSIQGGVLFVQDLGWVWIATSTNLYAISGVNGNLTAGIDPFPGTEKPIAMFGAGSDGSVWLGSDKGRIYRRTISGSGGGYMVLPTSFGIRDLTAIPREGAAPSIVIQSPRPADWLNTGQPVAQLTYSDWGTGLDLTTLRVWDSNGDWTCTPAASSATCTPPWARLDGSRTVSAQISDHAKNVSTTATVLIQIDTIPPALAITAPGSGATIAESQPAIALTFSDERSGINTTSLSLEANDVPLAATCSLTASTASCIPSSPMAPGSVTLTARLRDRAGNIGTATTTFVVQEEHDTTAPALALRAPLAGAAIPGGRPAMLLSFSDGGFGSGVDTASLEIRSGNAPIDVDCTFLADGARCRPSAPLPLGAVTLSATIADIEGNVSAAVSVSFTVVPGETTIVGTIRDQAGSPVGGAEVFAVGRFQAAATSASDGSFSLPSVEIPIGEALRVGARFGAGDNALAGGSGRLQPGVNGITDAGVVTVRPLCALTFSSDLPGTDSGAIAAIAAMESASGTELYVAGGFQLIGGQNSKNIARWDGTAWRQPSYGLEASVRALAVFDDGAGAALYAAGDFGLGAYETLRFIAKWDGQAWVAVGGGTNHYVDALEVYDDGTGPALIAAGYFDSAGGKPARGIAKWDGLQWSALGSGLGSDVHALETYDDGTGSALYAGGDFNLLDGVVDSKIARWNGSTWTPVGVGVAGPVMALAVADLGQGPALYVGGSFESAGGIAARNLARWSSNGWAPLGEGLESYVEVIRGYDDGNGPNIFVGGDFGGGLRRWDGIRWSGVGGGLDGDARALGEFVEAGSGYPGALIVGGYFTQAGGRPSVSLAKWGRDCTPGDGAPPGFLNLQPSTGLVTSATQVTISGALDESATLTINAQPVTLAANRSFLHGPIGLVAGRNSFELIATDPAGNSAKTSIQVYRDNTAPTLQFSAPAAGATVTTVRPALEFQHADAAGLDGSSLVISRAGSPLQAECTYRINTSSCALVTALPTGANTLTATIRDLAGNISALAQRSFTVTSSGGATTTVVGVVQLVGGAAAAGAEVSVLGVVGAQALSQSNGSFTISGVASSAPLTAVARLNDGSQTLLGTVAGVTPVAGGTTNLGTLVLRPLCAQRFDPAFNTSVGVDGAYPLKDNSFYPTYLWPRVRALAVYDDGTGPALYVGGLFQQAGGVPANNIAKWNGQQWSALGTANRGGGVNATVLAMAVYNGALHVGGVFTSADGLVVKRLARWNGQAWSDVGQGVTGLISNNTVFALAVMGSDLYVAGTFDLVGPSGSVQARNIARWNGSTWFPLGPGLGQSYHAVNSLAVYGTNNPVLYAGGDFLYAGTLKVDRIAKWSGSSWSTVGGGVNPESELASIGVYAMRVYKGDLYAAGSFNRIGTETGYESIARWDGRRWSKVGSGLIVGGVMEVVAQGIQALAEYDDGTGAALYALGDIGLQSEVERRQLVKWNGSAWSYPGGGLSNSSGIGGMALAVFDPNPTDTQRARLYVGNSSSSVGADIPSSALVGWDGASWYTFGEGVSDTVLALTGFAGAESGDAALYVAPQYQHLRRWDGRAWSQLPPFTRYQTAYTLGVFNAEGAPRLYAGGDFTTAGPWAANRIASWNGRTWAPVGNGFDAGEPDRTIPSQVRALAQFDDGSGEHLYAAGYFRTGGGAPLDNIAKWDGSIWQPLGTGIYGGQVYALAVYDDGSGPALYAAGYFSAAGGIAAAGIAKWNGTEWSSVGGGTDYGYWVTALAVFDAGSGPRLYAAGNFTGAAGQSARHIARWDGAQWQPLGSGLDGEASSLTVFDDGRGAALYVGGDFRNAGGVPAKRLAKWDGTRWSAVGSDLDTTLLAIINPTPGIRVRTGVFALAGFDDGSGPALYTGGHFAHGPYGTNTYYGSQSNGGEVNYLARLANAYSCDLADTQAPTLAWSAPAAGGWVNSARPSLSLQFSDDRSGVDTASLLVTANGAAISVTCQFAAAGAQCLPVTPLPSGAVALSAGIRDAAGNLSAAALLSFSVDENPPTVTIAAPVPGGWSTNRPGISLVFSDTGSGIDSTRLSIDLDGLTLNFDCVGSAAAAVCTPTTNLTNGPATARAAIRDLAGNASAEAVVSFTVESSLPTIAFTTPAEGASLDDRFTPIVLAFTDTGSGPDTASLELRANGQTLVAGCAFDAGTATCTPTVGLPEGPVTMTGQIRDRAGNYSLAASRSIVILPADTVAPVLTVTSPVAGTATRDPGVSASGSLSEQAALTLNGEAVSVGADLTFSAGPVALAEGPNLLRFVATDAAGNVGSVDRTVVCDTTGPSIAFQVPAAGAVCDADEQTVSISWSDVGSSVNPSSFSLTANGQPPARNCQTNVSGATCAVYSLPLGAVTLAATVEDALGNVSTSAAVACFTDPTLGPPAITVLSPGQGSVLNTPQIRIVGQLSKTASLTINGQPVPVTSALGFQAGPYSLTSGVNTFSLEALDGSGNSGQLSLTVTFDNTPPSAVNLGLVSLVQQGPGRQQLAGAAGAVDVSESDVVVAFHNLATGARQSVVPGPDGSFLASVVAFSGDKLRLTVRDLAGNASAPGDLQVTGTLPVAADPATVAPPLAATVGVDACDLVGFFWRGTPPVQFGVSAESIDCERLAVVRGRVLDRSGAPLAGVRVEALGEPRFGATFTRSDGAFDFALGASSRVVLAFAKPEYFQVRRTVALLPQQFATIEDVVLTAPDAQVTQIESGGTSPQVARGSIVTDTSGPRQTTVLFPAGTTATLRLDGGASQSLAALDVRATEYSVGEAGRRSVPGTWSTELDYAYAVELSVDAAEAAGAAVEFSGPVPVYVENFHAAPVGNEVLLAYLDRATSTWVPAPSGRIVKILSITAGLADLDLTGSGQPASVVELEALGITDAERQQLAVLYPAGQSLSRVTVTHFSGWGASFWPKSANTTPAPAPVLPPPHAGDDNKLDLPAITPFGGTVETENQVLGETLGLAGTPFTLHYRSDRVPGRKGPYTLKIPVTRAQLPLGITRVDLALDIAGQHETRSFAPVPGLVHEFVWDRQEGFGRELQGQAQWTAKISHIFGASPFERKVERTYSGFLGTLDAAGAVALGGWTLSAQHFFDKPSGTLYYGDGRRRTLESAANNPHVLELVAGTGAVQSSGDGGPARRAGLKTPQGISLTRDGGLLIAEAGACRVRRVAKDGTITTVAGSVCVDGDVDPGDGGPAIAAVLKSPMKAVEGPDGAIYIADYLAHRLRRVDPESGTITTVAGTGSRGCTGNELAYPTDLGWAPDGGLLIVNVGFTQDFEGICSTIQTYTPDGGLTTLIPKEYLPGQYNVQPQGVASGADGSIYFTPINSLRRRPPGGAADPHWHIAGVGRFYTGSDASFFAGDGLPASSDTRFYVAGPLALGLDGTVYLVDRLNRRIRTVSPAERVDTLVGGGDLLPVGDGIQARRAMLAEPSGVALDEAKGVLYFSDAHLHQVWKVRLGEPKPGSETVVPEQDGSVRYIFDEHGHHLRTEDGVSGQVLLSLTYGDFAQADGRTKHLVTSIEDAFGNVTTVDRNGNGDATRIVAPFGQVTTLAVSPTTGYLTQLSRDGETVQVAHDPNGLLRSLTDPRSGVYNFDYDPAGRLSRVVDPATGSLDLTYTEQPEGWNVEQETALGRRSTMAVHLPSADASIATPLTPEDLLLRVVTDSAGLKTGFRETKDGRTLTTAPDGTITVAQLQADPLLGELAPFAETVETQTPSGLRQIVSTQRSKVPLAEGSQNAFRWTETTTVNGRSASAVYSRSAGSIVRTSPAGRQGTTNLDSFGRVIQEQVHGLEPVRTSYDARGRVERVEQGPQGTARTTTYAYDAQGYLASVTDSLQRSMQLRYDAVGRVIKQILPDLREVNFGYDASGNLTSVTPPSRPAHGFTYTPVDQLETYTPPDVVAGSDATSYTYNRDRQLTQIARPDGQTLGLDYDAAGRPSILTTPTGTTTYTYDSTTGHLTTIAAPSGTGGLSFQYDGSLVTAMSQNGPVPGGVSYTYDRASDASSNFWIASRTINSDGATAVAYQYDDDGLLAQAGGLQVHRDATNGLLAGTTLLKTGDRVQRTSFGEVERFEAGFDDGTCTPTAPPFAGCKLVLEQSFVRDGVGRIATKTETLRDPLLGQAAESHVYDYTFDPVGRLTEVKRDGAVWETYGYDANSNRTGWNDPWGSGTGTYDAQDRLLTYGDKAYTYSPNGELRSKTQGSATVTYTYDVRGSLTQVQLPEGITIDYLTDATGRRIGKKVNGVLVKRFVYGSGIAPLAELDSSGNVTSNFIYGTRGNVPDVMIRGGQTYRIVSDYLGSVRWVLNAQTGQVAQRVDYDAFGRVLLDTNPGFQPFGFGGGLYDHQTGLIRFGARDYDAETGRWTAKDPIGFAGGESGLYTYVGNDPVNHIDPLGLFGFLDRLQLGLDIIGLVPAYGEVADLANAGISLGRGDRTGAALSAAGAIPIAGWVATGGKLAKRAVDSGVQLADAGKAATEVLGAAKASGRTFAIGSHADSRVAKAIGFEILDVPQNVYSEALNLRWLDIPISRGEAIFLSTEPALHAQRLTANGVSLFKSQLLTLEMPYLYLRGYVQEGAWMIKTP